MTPDSGRPIAPTSAPAPAPAESRAILASLTRLVSRWTSLELQRSIADACGVALDSAALNAVYVLGLNGGAASQSSLADTLHLTRPSTSKLIGRLSDAGLVTQAADPADRRAVVVSLSGQGQKAYGLLAAAGERMVARALHGWDDAEASEFSAKLSQFVEILVTDAAIDAVAAPATTTLHA